MTAEFIFLNYTNLDQRPSRLLVGLFTRSLTRCVVHFGLAVRCSTVIRPVCARVAMRLYVLNFCYVVASSRFR